MNTRSKTGKAGKASKGLLKNTTDDDTTVKPDDKKSPQSIIISIIAIQKMKEDKMDIWKNSPYKDLVKLQSNNIGIVGETLIHNICLQIKINANIDGGKTKKIGGGKGDGLINGKTVEIKTAHQGSTTKSFQHELGEKPWVADYIIFVDISPESVYLTIFPNFTEYFYKNKEKCAPYFPTKTVTWRKKIGAFKLDTTVMPFIIRGVKLWGIDSVMASAKRRQFVWSQAANLIDFSVLNEVVQVWSLQDLIDSSSKILKGEVSGRVVVDVNQ